MLGDCRLRSSKTDYQVVADAAGMLDDVVHDGEAHRITQRPHHIRRALLLGGWHDDLHRRAIVSIIEAGSPARGNPLLGKRALGLGDRRGNLAPPDRRTLKRPNYSLRKILRHFDE